MNVIDFIRETAIFMAADRPDVYDVPTAVAELTVAIDSLRELTDADQPFAAIMFTSYLLARLEDDGVEEFILTRKLSSMILFEEEEQFGVYSHHPQIDLPSVLDDQDDY